MWESTVAEVERELMKIAARTKAPIRFRSGITVPALLLALDALDEIQLTDPVKEAFEKTLRKERKDGTD